MKIIVVIVAVFAGDPEPTRIPTAETYAGMAGCVEAIKDRPVDAGAGATVALICEPRGGEQ